MYKTCEIREMLFIPEEDNLGYVLKCSFALMYVTKNKSTCKKMLYSSLRIAHDYTPIDVADGMLRIARALRDEYGLKYNNASWEVACYNANSGNIKGE
jgi:hypothetical protein